MEVLFDFSLQDKKVKSQFLRNCHSEWYEILINALETMDQDYLYQLMDDKDWLPGKERLFAAFSLPLIKTQYILLGESPYPRQESANGYAFWDNSVENLWSLNGLSKTVNRATSFRNIIKMLLRARGDLKDDTSQKSIALLDKSSLVQTAKELFERMMQKGILLLNACLVYSEGRVPYHARKWMPFMQSLFAQLALIKPDIQLILFGKIAKTVAPDQLPIGLIAEHPYNVSFITNPEVIHFFKPLDLLHHEYYRNNC
ncbi:uracil-DNA glycosylase [Legionella gratiana]|uniref:Uracil-DNA glycosylase n=1 Tax=Legionella gratiana TaxID=45066 RepID=A0A378JCL6_9GAMM|nr:uracil-DNA glycosylase family protein [Legionella gratiana]KTD11029.1 uracil-DNA glycosylase [Legionella gratiana]STX44627.1 uracil-DNA glycosylase [Legionella gratiana]